MTKDEALKLALEALEAHADIGINSDKAIIAIKQALAQPQQEPVRIMGFNCKCGRRMEVSAEQGVVPAPQRTWVGLTAGEILDTLISVDEKTVRLPSMLGQFACAIEAKLKEKNNA